MEEKCDACTRLIKPLGESHKRGIAVEQLYKVGAVVHRDGVRLQSVEDLEASGDEEVAGS